MMDDDGLTRYYSGNPSKDFFGKDRYIQYVSSEASGIEEEKDEEYPPQQQQWYQPQQLPQQWYQPQQLSEQLPQQWYQPSQYQTTEYIAANALYKSKALLEELHHFEAAKQAFPVTASLPVVSPVTTLAAPLPVVTPAPLPVVQPVMPTEPLPVVTPAPLPAVQPVVSTEPLPAVTPVPVVLAEPLPEVQPVVPTEPLPVVTPVPVVLAEPLPAVQPALTAAMIEKLNQATSEEEKCGQQPLQQVTVDDRACKGACSKGWGRVTNPQTGEVADWCYTTDNKWGICNPFTLTNSCTSKNLYTLSRLEEYMDSKEYNDFIQQFDDSKVTRKNTYAALQHVAQHVQGAFCDITAPKEGNLMYRLCDESSNMYDPIMEDINSKIESNRLMLKDTNFFKLNTLFPTKQISKQVWAIALHLLPISSEEFYRLIVKRYNRVNKSGAAGIDWKKLGVTLGIGAILTGAAMAQMVPAGPVSSPSSQPTTTDIPESPVVPIEPSIEPVAPIAPIEPIAPIVPIEPLAPIAPIEPVAPVAPIEPLEPIAPIESADSEGLEIIDLDEFHDTVQEEVVVDQVAQEVSTSIAQVEKSPIQESINMDTAQTISAALTSGDYVDIMNALPTIQATNTPQSIQLAVAQTANFNVFTNPGAAHILATTLSDVYETTATQLMSSWVYRLFNTLSPEKALLVQQTTDVCATASELYQIPPVTHHADTLLLSCNALETGLTVSPRVEANVESALNRMETSAPAAVTTMVPALCNLITKFPVYIHASNIVQSLFKQQTAQNAASIQRATSTVALARTKSGEPPSPVFVPHVNKLDAQPSFTTQLSAAALNTAAFGLSTATTLAAFAAFAPLGVYKVITHYLTSPAVVEAASSPTMVSTVNVMNNPYCTYMSRWDTRLRKALESTDSVDQLVYNETSETCSMLYALIGREAPRGASVSDAITAVQAELPSEPDYRLYAAAYNAQATFIENVTATNNAELIQATQALLLSVPEEQAPSLEAVKTLVKEEVKESFTNWQTAQTILKGSHPNGTLTKDMIAPIGELYTSFVGALQYNATTALAEHEQLSARIRKSMVTTAQTVIEQAQALSTPPEAPLSSLMLSEIPPKPFTWDDLSKPNWLQRTCNLASKNMTDSTNGPLVIDVLPHKIVPNLNSPWTLVSRNSAFIGVARMNGALTWVNATCTVDGGLAMKEVPAPSNATTFMAQCPRIEEAVVPSMAWNVNADFTVNNPEALKQDVGKQQQPQCVFVPYSWALPSNAKLSPLAIEFFEQVYSQVTFESEDKPLALGMTNTVAPLVASAGIGSVSNALSNVAGFAIIYVLSAISDAPSPMSEALKVFESPRVSMLHKRIAGLNSAKQMLLSASAEIKELDQFSKTRAWILQEHEQTVAQIKSAVIV